MDEGEYDEFGNYIGGGLDDDENSSIDDTRSRQEHPENGYDEDGVSETHSRAEPDWDGAGPAPPLDQDIVMDENEGLSFFIHSRDNKTKVSDYERENTQCWATR